MILFVIALVTFSRGNTFDEFRPGFIRFPGKEYVAETVEVCFIHGGIGTSDHRKCSLGMKLEQDLPHPSFLNIHPGQADDVKTRDKLEVNFLDIFVEQIDFMALDKPSKVGQRSSDHRTPDVAGIERQGVIKAPIRRLKLGVEEACFYP